MKKNGYLRRFLALFLALVMIMADSSVTTFAATVGRVKQKSAAAESSSQCNVQINVAEELDVEQFSNDYKYIMLGTETPDKWPGIGATSSIEKISTTENVVLNDVAEGTEKKIYFVQGKESWQWGAYKTTGDTFQQGENKFKISVSETASGLTVNINKVEFISRNVQIVADADLDFAAFTNQYKYVMLGKTTSSGVEAVSTIEQIDSNTTDVELKVDKDENADDLKLYFIRDTYNLNSNLTNDSKFKQGNVNYKIAVTTDNNNFNVNIEKVVFQPGPTVDYKSVLGNSLHFGIVANDFTCNGDLEANLAVGTLHGSGNMKSSKNYGGNGTTLIGAYVDYGWYIFKNSEGGQGDLILYTTPDAANRFGNDIWSKGLVIDTETYSQEEIQNIVRSMVDESRMTSNKLASDAHTKGLKYSSVADENGVIDLTTSPAGTYYIDFEIGEYANSNLNLKITGDQNIVLNIPDETATLKTYQLNIDGKNCNIGGYANGGIGEKACENIIFNLNNASSVISETIHGVVLVPNGSFENKAVGAGWIVADSVTSGGTEWHCLSRDIPVVTSYAIKAKKTVNGKAPSGNEAGKFTFKLYKIDDKGNETLVDTKSNGDGGLVSFDTFGNITEAGTYWYKITEEGTVAGYTIDTTVYYAEVVVNATPSNGVIISKNAKVTYHKGTKTGDTATVATFNNIKKEDETSANIKVKKTFTNGAADKKFNFVLTPINNAPMPEGAVNGKKTISVAQNDGVKNFGEIKYTTAGTYRYEVVEDSSEQAAGITYDNHRWTVTVAVPADFSTPTVTYSREDGITSTIGAEFTNSEENKETEITLEGTKSLSGRNLKAGEFKFEVKDEVGTVVATGTNDAAGKIAFSRIGYKLSDLKKGDGSYASEKTYSYKVSEVKGNAGDGITYDDKEYTVKVKVSYDQASGTMKAELADKDQKLAFANSYDTETGIDLEGTKSLEGRTLKDGEFTFEVKDKAGKVVATGSNKSDGSISFNNKLNYKLSDLEKADGSYESEKTYEYTVNEVIPEGATAENNYTVNGVTYDSKTVNVKVTVTYNKETGELKAELAKDSEAIAFQNSYDTETSIGLEGTKSLSGRTLKDGEFTFEVKDKAGKVVATGSNKSDGSISFNNKLNYKLSDLEKADGSYESEKTYEYTVNEVIPEGATAENNYTVNGVTYDNSIFTVKVIVSYDQATGIMSAAFAEDSQELIFDNTYDAKGSLTLEASKTLKNKALEADAFNFVLKDKNGETIQTVANDADGNVTFSPLNYTLKDVGTHVYTVSEVQRENTEVTYDTTEYTVEVTVADAGNGKLKVSKTIKKGDYTVDAIAFENIYKGVIDISGSKTWNDADNQDGIRPASITVKLFANGTEAASQVVTPDEAGNWNYVFKNLPQYDAKGKITYTVTESAVAGYETSVSGYNITNTHKPATLDITGTKTWNDSNNQDGKRPKSITVNLLANGIITDTKTVTADDNWTYSFTDLPKYANGQEITYTVSELTVPGYTTTIDDNYNITNSYTPGETSASVTKIWDDADNQDGIRPESITVALLANGTPTNKTVTLTAANNWTQTITGLPEKADGEYITYTWTEVNVPEGYSLTGTSKNETVTTLTNTHTPELTSITGTKTWKDADNQDGKRPESITVNLFADGTKLKSQSVSADADGNWSYSFTDLPKYANGQEITYTVTEDAVDGYTTESDGYNFINTHQPETTEITGTKTWNDANNQDGKRPESITVILLANGTEKTRQAVTADEAGNWTYTFKDLPKYANGQEITYTVAEEEVTDYTTTYDGSNITNSYTPGKTSATVTKIWNDAENQDGKRPESITVSLLADGKETGKTVTLSVENNWKQTISDLPEKADGKAIEYTWTEETLPEGYELTDNSKNGTVTTLTNTYAPETTSITVTKTWDDADNQDGKRPESIIVNLLANGEIVASQTVKADEAGNWTYTFKDLPKYANGKEITYTVTEEAVEGYETSVDGFNITNTYTTETTEVKGSKTWNDADNQDGKRPESITVRLLANGEEKDSQTVTADENGNWTYSFEKLPKYEAGKEILYTVTEDAVADYTTEITGYDITNSYAPGKTSVTVTKAWADNDDRGGHRPKEIKVQLKADGENSGEEITLNAENNWTYTWSDLDQKKAGKDIAYTVEETGKAVGYISTVTGNAEEGFIITNTITSVKISKVDITDQKELAGAHIQVIDKDGNVVEEWDSTWEAHEVTGLKPGETYTLRETVAPEGYTLTSDTTFTLKEDGTVNKDTTTTTISDNGTLLVEDSRTSVKVSKVDISDGKELEGAHIQIIDQDGNVVDEWDSTKEAHVTEKLKTGKIYTLRETVAPDGYLLTSDTTFVLKEDGTVDAEKTTAVSKDGVLLVQDKLATAASIAVTKKLTYIGENLAARDQTFYVALYSDKECTQRVSDVKALVFKNADASTVVFSENIKAGKTYYIAECTQDGTSQTIGALADGTVYEAVFGNGNSTTVTEANGTTTVSFENVFSSFPPDGFYKQGQLTITKKVLGADGGTRNSNEVFYAGIFDDAAHTQLSQQVEQNIIKLDMDGGYEVSEIINVGLAQSGAKVTLYVTETDSNGKPIAGSEGFGYKVTVSADSVIFDETNMTAEVVITNQEESTVTETPTPTPSSDGGNSGGSENHSGGYGGGKSPKTGDDTPIGTYLMLLLAAAMLAAETERRRRRNKRQ